MRSAGVGPRAAHSSTRPYSFPWWAWALTFLSYVALGFFLKSIVLNWIVGPLYPLTVMYLLPTGLRRLRGRDEPGELIVAEHEIPR